MPPASRQLNNFKTFGERIVSLVMTLNAAAGEAVEIATCCRHSSISGARQ